MKIKSNGFLSFVSLILLVTIACNLSTSPPVTPSLPAQASAAPIESVLTPTLASSIQHTMTPPADLPSVRGGAAADTDSSTTAGQHRAPGGDRFTFDRFERPFNSTSMDVYFPGIDIQTTAFYEDGTWMYGSISLKSYDPKQDPPRKYGYEIDTNVDGGGDWLILAVQPSSTDWSTDSAQVWFDTNHDVGGSLKALTDKNPQMENGFETMVFGEGHRDDPDVAWARISPDDPNTIQIAAKRSLLGGDDSFLVGMWAGGDDFSPSLFDLNDLYTQEQAGAALKELEFYYPIKEVAEIDNACRMAIGFAASGNEPGLCEVFNPTKPPRPTPGCQVDPATCANMGSGFYFDAPSCSCKYFG